MAARDYILNNFRWKLLAIALALFAWVSIQSSKNSAEDHVVFRDRPINVLRPAGDSTIYRVTPPNVTVTLRGEAAELLRLSDRDIYVFVNLTIVPEIAEVARRVIIYAPEGVSARSDTVAVSVEKVLPSASAQILTNSFTNP